jgi:hypothetical protein
MRWFQRGAALPETALSLTVMLAVLVGSLRLALAGYEQIAADGAAFYNSHETSYNVTDPTNPTSVTAQVATNEVYPRSATATISPSSPLPAPTVNVYTQYGVDQPDNRHGGVSMIQPMQELTQVSKVGIDSLSPWTGGSLLNVTGYGVDVDYLEVGVHADVDGDAFNTGSAATDAVDYFAHGENTPPYFGGFNYMAYCPNISDSTTSYWNSCPNGVSYRALGLAEYLTTDNWTRTFPGLQPENAGTASGMFWETEYHHDVYSQISSALPPNLTGSTPDGKPNINLAQEVLDWNGAGAEVYYYNQVGGPNNPACPPIAETAPTALSTAGPLCNADILKVYSWDQIHQAGNPPVGYTVGSLPLSPGAGYPPL